MNLSKILTGMKDAKPTKKGKYLTEGRYVLKIRNTLVVEPVDKAPAFILEAEVIESSDTNEHPVGTERTWYQGFKYKESAQGELKKFAYAVMSLDPANPAHKEKVKALDEQIEPFMQKVIEENKFNGQLVRCEVVQRATKTINPKTNEPGEFSSYNFTPYIAPVTAA